MKSTNGAITTGRILRTSPIITDNRFDQIRRSQLVAVRKLENRELYVGIPSEHPQPDLASRGQQSAIVSAVRWVGFVAGIMPTNRTVHRKEGRQFLERSNMTEVVVDAGRAIELFAGRVITRSHERIFVLPLQIPLEWTAT